MRRLTAALCGAVLSLVLSTSAWALTVDPNPLEFQVGHQTKGSVDFNISGTTLEMTVNVVKGRVSKTRVSVDGRTPLSAGWVDGPGVNIRRIKIRSNGRVDFYFKTSFFHNHIHAGNSSDLHYVTYDTLAAGDVITFTGFRNNIFGSFGSVQATIVPEPSAAIMVGLGLAGLVIAGRRRA